MLKAWRKYSLRERETSGYGGRISAFFGIGPWIGLEKEAWEGNTRISNELKYLTNNLTSHYTAHIFATGNHIEPPSVNRARSKTSIHHITMLSKQINRANSATELHLQALLFTSSQLLCTLHTKIPNQDSDPKITISIIQLLHTLKDCSTASLFSPPPTIRLLDKQQGNPKIFRRYKWYFWKRQKQQPDY
jgi:hypothetical protein